MFEGEKRCTISIDGEPVAKEVPEGVVPFVVEGLMRNTNGCHITISKEEKKIEKTVFEERRNQNEIEQKRHEFMKQMIKNLYKQEGLSIATISMHMGLPESTIINLLAEDYKEEEACRKQTSNG